MTAHDTDTIWDQGRTVSISGADFRAGIDDQRTWISARLRSFGRITDIEEVMAVIASDAWESLPRWDKAGRPHFPAWCNGVANNTLHVWLRKERRHQHRSLETTPEVAFDNATPVQDDHVDPATAAHIIGLIRARVMAKPGGVATWDRLERDALKPEAGERARQALRAELNALSRHTTTQGKGDVAS